MIRYLFVIFHLIVLFFVSVCSYFIWFTKFNKHFGYTFFVFHFWKLWIKHCYQAQKYVLQFTKSVVLMLYKVYNTFIYLILKFKIIHFSIQKSIWVLSDESDRNRFMFLRVFTFRCWWDTKVSQSLLFKFIFIIYVQATFRIFP